MLSRVYPSVGTGERLTLADGTDLAVDDVFARVMELPGDHPARVEVWIGPVCRCADASGYTDTFQNP